jgi:hypothetical protein
VLVDPEITALAGTAATTLVSLLTTEGWQRAKEQFASLWRRAQPERAEVIARELEVTRDDLLAAQGDDDSGIRAELNAEWQGRIRRLLAAHPDAAALLRDLLAELAPEALAAPSVTQHATASGHARVYQAGRDQNFGQG